VIVRIDSPAAVRPNISGTKAASHSTTWPAVSTRILDAHLRDRTFLVGNSLSVADFAVASALAYADSAKLPLAEFPAIQRWYARMDDLPAWRDPFPAQ
jgi:glutathione S-transferase